MTVKKPRGNKKGRSPVIAGRVPESLYRQIKEATKKSRRSMSEEMAWLVAAGIEWTKVLGERETWLANARAEQEAIERGDIEAALRRRNWKKVGGAAFGAANWISADNHSFPQNDFIDHAEAERPPRAAMLDPRLLEAIERSVTRAVEAALAKRATVKASIAEPSPACREQDQD